MAIPRAVREQGERAEQILQNLTAAPTQDTGAPDPQSTQQPAMPAPQQQPQGNAQGTWEQKYRTLQGMHQADRDRFRREVDQRDSQIRALSEKLEELSNQVQTQAPQTPAQAADVAASMTWEELGFSADDVEEYGEDYLKKWRNMAVKVVEKLTASSVGRVEQQVRNVAQQREEEARSKFYQALAENVPNWEGINVDPQFNAWLNERDGLSLRSRKQNLLDAVKALDATTAISYFTAFKESQSRSDNLSPNSFGGPQPDISSGEGPRPWRRSEIKAFYDAQSRGALNMTAEEAMRTEQSIIAAQATGRILPG